MYINLLLGNQNGFKNLTSQIQNISSDLKLTREEVFGRFDNLNTSLIHFFPDIFNHSDSGTICKVQHSNKNNLRSERQ